MDVLFPGNEIFLKITGKIQN